MSPTHPTSSQQGTAQGGKGLARLHIPLVSPRLLSLSLGPLKPPIKRGTFPGIVALRLGPSGSRRGSWWLQMSLWNSSRVSGGSGPAGLASACPRHPALRLLSRSWWRLDACQVPQRRLSSDIYWLGSHHRDVKSVVAWGESTSLEAALLRWAGQPTRPAPYAHPATLDLVLCFLFCWGHTSDAQRRLWLCAPGSLLAVLRGLCGARLGMEPGACEACVQPIELLSQSLALSLILNSPRRDRAGLRHWLPL